MSYLCHIHVCGVGSSTAHVLLVLCTALTVCTASTSHSSFPHRACAPTPTTDDRTPSCTAVTVLLVAVCVLPALPVLLALYVLPVLPYASSTYAPNQLSITSGEPYHTTSACDEQ